MTHRIPARRPAEATPADERPSNSARLTLDEYLDEQEAESFPASDPHSDWAGPPTPHTTRASADAIPAEPAARAQPPDSGH